MRKCQLFPQKENGYVIPQNDVKKFYNKKVLFNTRFLQNQFDFASSMLKIFVCGKKLEFTFPVLFVARAGSEAHNCTLEMKFKKQIHVHRLRLELRITLEMHPTFPHHSLKLLFNKQRQ